MGLFSALRKLGLGSAEPPAKNESANLAPEQPESRSVAEIKEYIRTRTKAIGQPPERSQLIREIEFLEPRYLEADIVTALNAAGYRAEKAGKVTGGTLRIRNGIYIVCQAASKPAEQMAEESGAAQTRSDQSTS